MKNKMVAAFLSLFLGVFGIQFFYIGRTRLGLLMMALTIWLRLGKVAFLVGLVMGILFLLMSDKEFNQKYNWKWLSNNPEPEPQPRQRDSRRESRRRDNRRNESPSMPRYESAKPNNQKAELETLKQAGIKKYKEYDYEGAIADFQNALQIDPNEAAAHWNLACCYSLTEQAERAFYHLERAVAGGMKEVEKIRTHESLAYLRMQPEFEAFVKNGYRLPDGNSATNLILQQQKELISMRQQGQITEAEYLSRNKELLLGG